MSGNSTTPGGGSPTAGNATGRGSRSAGAAAASDRGDAVVALGEVSVLAGGEGEAADEFVAEVLRLDDGVDDEIGGEAQ